jgi:hypothetical protein
VHTVGAASAAALKVKNSHELAFVAVFFSFKASAKAEPTVKGTSG